MFRVQELLVDTDVRRDLKKFMVGNGGNCGYYVARSPEYVFVLLRRRRVYS